MSITIERVENGFTVAVTTLGPYERKTYVFKELKSVACFIRDLECNEQTA